MPIAESARFWSARNCGVRNSSRRASPVARVLLIEAFSQSGCQAHGGDRRARYGVFPESGCLGMQPKAGGKLHLRLNTVTRPIANKYREGKLKSTLKRELKST